MGLLNRIIGGALQGGGEALQNGIALRGKALRDSKREDRLDARLQMGITANKEAATLTAGERQRREAVRVDERAVDQAAKLKAADVATERADKRQVRLIDRQIKQAKTRSEAEGARGKAKADAKLAAGKTLTKDEATKYIIQMNRITSTNEFGDKTTGYNRDGIARGMKLWKEKGIIAEVPPPKTTQSVAMDAIRQAKGDRGKIIQIMKRANATAAALNEDKPFPEVGAETAPPVPRSAGITGSSEAAGTTALTEGDRLDRARIAAERLRRFSQRQEQVP